MIQLSFRDMIITIFDVIHIESVFKLMIAIYATDYLEQFNVYS
jgi:hypothetical protein